MRAKALSYFRARGVNSMPDKDVVVFDIETRKDFEEVGGRAHVDKLGVSVVGAYSYLRSQYLTFEAHELGSFVSLLENAELVVGFNLRDFDLPVLQPHVSIALDALPVLDLMDGIVGAVGFRVGLDSLAQATLGTGKSADGLQAVRWWREGNIEAIKTYCLQDVRVTKELYEYGRAHGRVYFFSRQDGQKLAASVSWRGQAPTSVHAVLREAFLQRRRVRLVYANGEVPLRGSAPNVDATTRECEIHRMDNDIIEGYCYLRGAVRQFRIGRILRADVLEACYQLHDDVQGTLL